VNGRRLLGYGGICAILLGSILPWASGPFGISASGIGNGGTVGDGVITVILGILAAATFAAGTRDTAAHRGWSITAIVLAVLAAVVAGVDTARIFSVPLVSIGIGPPLIVLGALAVVVASVQALSAPSPPVPAGWYPDPQGTMRWWDGLQWTSDTSGPRRGAPPV